MTTATESSAGQLTSDATDAELAAWRSSAGTGRLPDPTRTDRWQILRAGVVNLWEFDVAEYWFADGRAQFAGHNQSGKSTLMALTTLIMLAGDLDRSLVDTFGQQHKSFRYYVEPTDDPTDRRATDTNTSRGWAWVEYGRIQAGVPQFFTTLLYAQAKRGQNDFTRRWATCEGDARVGNGLALHHAASTTQPQELADVPGFRVAANGKEYKTRLAAQLFGFDDAGRLDAVVAMLKLLRTPHLGQKLDPDYFTKMMREALPAVARSEIDELAEGWDQLDRLAADRERTEEARQAVQAYVRKAWGPWADAVLRRAADDLVAATTAVDNVTREEKTAENALADSRAEQQRLEAELERTTADHAVTQTQYEEFRTTPAYTDAAAARTHAQRLRRLAAEKAATAHETAQDAARAEQRAIAKSEQHTAADREHGERQQEVDVAVGYLTADVSKAGLDNTCHGYAQARDVDRVRAAIDARRTHLADARRLLHTSTTASQKENSAAQRAADLQHDLKAREDGAQHADDALTAALTDLSDNLERWVLTVPHDAPITALRSAWLDQVTSAAASDQPRAVLGQLINTQWLTPLITPLSADARDLLRAADGHRQRAEQLEQTAAAREAQTDPEATDPPGWSRRARPAAGPDGAPLWRLLDPVDNLDPTVLDHLEAALHAAGLLDAWVTPDGVYRSDRDGNDTVVTLAPAHLPGEGGDTGTTLTAVLQPAEDSGACAGTVRALLATVTYTIAGEPGGRYAVTGEGRWTDPGRTGFAAPSPHGAELIGTAARAAARGRHVAQLRAEAAQLRVDADTAAAEAARIRGAIQALTDAEVEAPSDATVVRAALAAATARAEVDRALRKLEPARRAAAAAETAAASARADLLNFTSDHRLPHDDDGLTRATTDLDAAGTALGELRAAMAALSGAAHTLQIAASARDEAREHHRALRARAARAAQDAEGARKAAEDAEERLGKDDQAILARERALREDLGRLAALVTTLTGSLRAQEERVRSAEAEMAARTGKRVTAALARDEAVERWWVPVDQGLAERRNVPAASGRLQTHALAQARAARERLSPANWPDKAVDRDARVGQALAKMSGGPDMVALRQVLEASSGRTVTVTGSEVPGVLTSVLIGVDTSGTQLDPVAAIAALREQGEHLARLHDDKIQEVLVELLSSTFVEHLRERLTAVVTLLRKVNKVLAAHPTGANGATMRLQRVPAGAQRDAFAVLDALERGAVDSPAVQEQVRAFLSQQIATAQDLGRGGLRDWKEDLAEQLDYRRWFDVITEIRVGDSSYRALTKEVHAKDSGGGKVITLLQPLLATLVALYDESRTAPRPLWLDEAFTGVDDDNRATMLGMLTTFDLDFLLAGPGTVVNAAQVPAAAIWLITRAPAPTPGVDLSMMLWAGQQIVSIPIPAASMSPAPATPADLTLLDLVGEPAP